MMSKTIFYSWQSDIDDKTNKILIRDCLKQAAKKCKKEDDSVVLRVDTDTQGATGTPSIEQEIFRKIDECFIFVADVTIINKDYAGRKTPNPNVLLELGYAVKKLGWNKVICLYNTAYGSFEDLPLDLRGRKPKVYNLPSNYTDEDYKKITESLVQNLQYQIRSISEIEEETEELQPSSTPENENLKRKRDIQSLTKVLSYVSINAMEKHIGTFQQSEAILGQIFHYFYNFMNFTWSPSFYIYNNDLKEITFKLYNDLEKTLNHGLHFTPEEGDYYRLYKGSYQEYDEYQRVASQIHNEMSQLKNTIKEFVSYIKENYIEIDMDELDNIAREKYNIEYNEIKESMNRK